MIALYILRAAHAAALPFGVYKFIARKHGCRFGFGCWCGATTWQFLKK